jgi:hypothetical protein
MINILIFSSSADHVWANYRQVPTFGRDTIRKFMSNVSEFKIMAARDYEDLLQESLKYHPL